MHIPMIFRTAELPAQAGACQLVLHRRAVPGTELGTLTLEFNAKHKIAEPDEPLVGGVLVTAGGLVFSSEGNGGFSAFDAKDGAKVWSFNCGPGVSASPVSFEIEGNLFVAVAAGGSQIWDLRQG